MTAAIKSVLHEVQEQQGAEFMEDAGWTWTTTFGDAQAEYDAIRSGVSMWDVYGLQKFHVTGRDAGQALQRVFANDLSALAVGQVRYGPFVDASGAMVDDGTIYKLGDDSFWMMTNNESAGDYLREHAGGLTVDVAYRTHEMPVISVQGPGSRDLLARLTDADIHGLRYFRFLPEKVRVAGIAVWLTRTGFSGELGFELFPAREDAVALWSALAAEGVVGVGLDAVEVARVEAGLVIVGVDYTPGETSPFDLSMDKTIATGKDLPILGLEVLRATAAAPPRRFKTLRVGGDTLPEYGAAVLDGETVVGTLTSPVDSPPLGQIGLAILETPVAGNGTELSVAVGDGLVTAVVDDLSVLDPAKTKPRS